MVVIYLLFTTNQNDNPRPTPQCATSRNTPSYLYSAVYDNPNAIVSLAVRRYHHHLFFCWLVICCIVLASCSPTRLITYSFKFSVVLFKSYPFGEVPGNGDFQRHIYYFLVVCPVIPLGGYRPWPSNVISILHRQIQMLHWNMYTYVFTRTTRPRKRDEITEGS